MLLKPKSIGVCYFIGKEKYAKLHHDCKADVFYNYIGKEINLEWEWFLHIKSIFTTLLYES